MAANTAPIFTLTGQVSSDSSTAMAPTFTTAAADYTGATATHNKVVFTAGADGSYIVKLRFKAVSSNVVTVARIFLNNGSAHTSAANNSFFGEISLPAVTASATVAGPEIDYPMGIALNAGYAVYVGLGTTVAGGWVCTGVGGDY